MNNVSNVKSALLNIIIDWTIHLTCHMTYQGGKFLGCAEYLRRGKFTNFLHFGAELWQNELVWRTGVLSTQIYLVMYTTTFSTISVCISAM
jgi:hypothetical protein